MANKKTFKLALGGICLALSVVFMFGASFVPGVELTLYALSSLFIAVMIIETGVKGGVLLYVAAVLLGLLVVPNKVAILPYACLFGIYGILKYYIEKIRNPVVQVLLKVLFFAGLLSAAFLGFRGVALGNVELPDLPAGVLIAAGVLFLLLYDLIYTLLIRIYRKRFRKQEVVSFHLSEKENNENDQ
ncbi:hypothetical protein NE619_01330 [Anaerovorax odorimutans]|uniref:DUF2232 domain-containing protein n=1 Tax=Anaerovorax odorimutans TaxID=109327 RepID=A0ABT1RJK7_9FIRM|nr:hypothetical protein [Anaerovorax odorimutans]MCQ4635358.1 hypothetical protein [Anaerovorax odorimutans]